MSQSPLDSPLTDAYVEITDFCNLQCQHCYRLDRNHPHHKPLTDLNANFQLLNDLQVQNVILTGGEPFAHPQISEIIDQLASYPFYKGIITNGSYPAPSNIVKMDVVDVSLEFFGKKQDGFRGFPGIFAKIVNLLAALEGKVKRNIVTAVFRENRTEYLKLIEFAQAHADNIVFAHYVPINPFPTPYSSKENLEIINFLEEQKAKYEYEAFDVVFYELFFYVQHPSRGEARKRCKSRLFVRSDNKFSLCPFYPEVYDTIEEVLVERQ
jgi:MoaA/NifB/PqqE/SkfB family radical SAM enzyme